MRKYMILTCMAILCLMLTACESENIKSAKKAYAQSDYLTVINLLEKEENLDDEEKDMLAVSQANIFFSQKNYEDATSALLMSKTGRTNELYYRALDELIEESLKNSSADALSRVAAMSADTANYITNEIILKCNSYSLAAFNVLDGLAAKLPDGDAKNNLVEYSANNRQKRTMSYLIGKWQWKLDIQSKTIIDVMSFRGNLIGKVDVVGENQEKYPIWKDDIYWKDFTIIDDYNITCTSILRDLKGNEIICPTTGVINYDDSTLTLTLTAPEPYSLQNPVRVWKKI